MARVGGVNVAVRCEDGVSSAPGKSNGADLLRSGDGAHGGDEGVDDGFAYGLAMLDEPGR